MAAVTTVFIMNIKIRALKQSSQIEYMSQTDLLTGVKNRNHYENQLKKYPQLCASNLVCVYGDVNGLHEKNNSEGHEAGEIMLRTVAEALQAVFGPEHTFRIGGDEFVAFRTDAKMDAVTAEIDQLRRELAEKGYHVSFGVAEQDKAQGGLDMHGLVMEADRRMLGAKQEFYCKPENNRRNRQADRRS